MSKIHSTKRRTKIARERTKKKENTIKIWKMEIWNNTWRTNREKKFLLCHGQGVLQAGVSLLLFKEAAHTFDAAHDRVSEFAVFPAKKSRDYARNVPRDFLPRIPGVFPRRGLATISAEFETRFVRNNGPIRTLLHAFVFDDA